MGGMTEAFSLKDAKIGIAGLGLMGGSLALGLRGHCRALFGCDPNPAVIEQVRRRDLLDRAGCDPAEVLPGAGLVILAAPVPAILGLLDQLPRFMSDACIVLDIGSTKRSIVEAMSRLPERFDPIGGHPLCGKEKLSIDNADRNLYQTAPFLLTPLERTSVQAISAAHQIIAALGGRAVVLGAADHDRALATTSHLPFLLSCALSLATPEEFSRLAGPGYQSASRLAGTPASMMLGVLESNIDNILQAVHEFQNRLAEIESVLGKRDFSNLETLLDEARSRHEAFVQ